MLTDDQERDNFIDRLGEIVCKTKSFCFAWAFPSHVHILLRTGQTPLATVGKRRAQDHMKSDERILGDGEFTQLVLDETRERLEER